MSYRRLLLWLLLFALPLHGTALAEMRTLVLVSGKEAPELELNAKETRVLFMGLPAPNNKHHIEPLLNASDPLVYEVFLQKVIFMSAQNYERRLLTKVFRLGGKRPQKYRSRSKLLQALAANPYAVSFMWRHDAQRHSNLKVVTELWSGNIE